MAPSSKSTKLLYKVKSRTDSDGTVVHSILSCIDDVEHQRHRRNPFDPKYVQAALSSFEELGRDESHSVPTREDVEAASTSIHVRTQLIKSMKDGLVKLTSEALKHWKGHLKYTPRKKQFIKEIPNDKDNAATNQTYGRNDGSYFRNNRTDTLETHDGPSFQAFQVEIGWNKSFTGNAEVHDNSGIGLDHLIKELEPLLHKNPNFLPEDELCYEYKMDMNETLQSMLERIQSEVELSLTRGDECLNLKPYKSFISPVTKELIFDFKDFQQACDEGEDDMDESISQLSEVEVICSSHCSGDNIQNGCVSVLKEVHKNNIITSSTCPRISRDQICVQKTIDPNYKCTAAGSCSTTINSVNSKDADAESSISSDSESYDEVMYERVEPDEIQNDVDDAEIDTEIHLSIQTEFVEKFIQLRRNLKKPKHRWLLNNPEKLLIPDNNQVYPEPKIPNFEYYLSLHASKVGKKIFEQSILKPDLDLIERYNMIQTNPSKVPGMLHFSSPDGDKDHANSNAEDCTELDEDMLSSNGTFNANFSPPQQCGQTCWDEFSWSTQLSQKNDGIQSTVLVNATSQETDRLSNPNTLNCLSNPNTHNSTYVSSNNPIRDGSSNQIPNFLSCRRDLPIELGHHDIERTEEPFPVDRNADMEVTMNTMRPFSIEIMKNVMDNRTVNKKERYVLNELIARAVADECQQQKTMLKHHDMEPLSSLLSAEIASYYEKTQTKEITFKDLVNACRATMHKGLLHVFEMDISVQRYFLALLILTHQHNMGNYKNTTIKDFQMFMKQGSSGKLSDIIITLTGRS